MVKHTRMEENKRVYEADYNTDEYEDLTCECHHLARAKELNGSRRKPFFCIHCKTVYKDKNKLNLHRLEGCFAVTGDGRKTTLKIYPVFGKGQRGEIEDILIKHGYMNPRKKPSRAKRKKSAIVVTEANTPNEEEIGVQAAEDKLTPPRPQKLKVRGMLSSAREARKKRCTAKRGECQVPPRDHQHAEDNPESGDSAVVVGQGQMQVQMQLKRGQVEAQAWVIANTTILDATVASCPEVVPCPGLWHLMNFQLLPSDFPHVNNDSFLEAFQEFVEQGRIDPGLRSSYGTWYMESETDAGEDEQNAVKLTMSRFKLSGGRPDLEARNKERISLQQYLRYLQELTQYEAQKAACEAELRLRREKHVKDILDEFDAREHAHKELALWHWSPLLHLLKSDCIGGVPPRPWTHCDAEQRKIAHAILMNRRLIVNDSPQCPIIVRMFKIVYLYCFDKTSTLSDPVTGLLRETMLAYSTNESAAPVLKISAQSVLNEGCFLFANMAPDSQAQAEVFEDINSLLNGPEAEREAVVDKVQTFLKIIRQRAAGDMAQLHPKEFRVLWCGGDETAIDGALKEFMLCLKSREDLDMGWVSFPSGHPDCDSIPVMQAKEAVMKSTNQLHEQRVLSDRNRLIAAPPCLQAIGSDTHEKFLALVDTCVGKSQKKVAVASSNGVEVGAEDGKNVSNVGSELGYSGGSAEVGESLKSSQPSHEVDKTSISCNYGGRIRDTHDVVGELSHDLANQSPDLNLNPRSINAYVPSSSVINHAAKLATHVAGLHVVDPVAPPAKLSFLGFQVQTSNSVPSATTGAHFSGARSSSLVPSVPLHFPVCRNIVEPTGCHEHHSESSVSRPSILQPTIDNHADSVHVVSSLSPTALPSSSFHADPQASAHQAAESQLCQGHL